MGFRNGAYATVWSVESVKSNVTKVRISVSRKNRQTDTYEQDFSGYCSFVGNCAVDALKLRERDRIRLGDVDVTTKYDAANRKEYVNYAVFSFEHAEQGPAPQNHSPSDQPPEANPTETDNDKLPF